MPLYQGWFYYSNTSFLFMQKCIKLLSRPRPIMPFIVPLLPFLVLLRNISGCETETYNIFIQRISSEICILQN